MLVRPVGGYPDDSFHFANIWCDEGVAGFRCSDVEGSPKRLVPNVFTDGSPWWDATGLGENLQQPTEVYPSLFYWVMKPFAGEAVVSSVVRMRLLNITSSVVLLALAYGLLPATRRFGFAMTWLAIGPGLGLFYLASNHPFAWLYLGAGTGWAFTVAAIEASDLKRRSFALLGLCVAITMMVGSRPEGQVIAALTVLAGIGVSDPSRLKMVAKAAGNLRFGTKIGLVVGLVLAMSVLMWLVGFSVMNRAMLAALDQARSAGLVSRLVDVPYLYMLVLSANPGPSEFGVFGAQSAFLLVAVVGVVVLGLQGLGTLRKVTAAALLGIAVFAPLAWGNLELGVVRTPPRYLVVFALLTIAAANASTPRNAMESRGIGWSVPVAALVIGHAFALHGAIRSYRVGEPPEWTFGLNGGLKWWWQWGPSPQSTWLLGTVAFGVLVSWLMHSAKTRAALVQV